MAVTVPTSLVRPSLLDYSIGQVISSAGLAAIIEAGHYQYSVAGINASGLILDPVFTTTSTTYTRTNSTAGGRNLNTWWSTIQSYRPGESAPDSVVYIEASAWIANCTLGIEVYQDTTLLGTLELASASATIEVVTGRAGVIGAAGSPLTMRPVGVKAASGSTGRLAQFAVRDAILVAADMPRGR